MFLQRREGWNKKAISILNDNKSLKEQKGRFVFCRDRKIINLYGSVWPEVQKRNRKGKQRNIFSGFSYFLLCWGGSNNSYITIQHTKISFTLASLNIATHLRKITTLIFIHFRTCVLLKQRATNKNCVGWNIFCTYLQSCLNELALFGIVCTNVFSGKLTLSSLPYYLHPNLEQANQQSSTPYG